MTLGGYWHILASFYVSFWDPGRGYLHIFASFYVSFWDPGKKWHRNQNYRTVYAKLIIERKNNYRTKLVNVGKKGENTIIEHTRIIERQKKIGVT